MLISLCTVHSQNGQVWTSVLTVLSFLTMVSCRQWTGRLYMEVKAEAETRSYGLQGNQWGQGCGGRWSSQAPCLEKKQKDVEA